MPHNNSRAARISNANFWFERNQFYLYRRKTFVFSCSCRQLSSSLYLLHFFFSRFTQFISRNNFSTSLRNFRAETWFKPRENLKQIFEERNKVRNTKTQFSFAYHKNQYQHPRKTRKRLDHRSTPKVRWSRVSHIVHDSLERSKKTTRNKTSDWTTEISADETEKTKKWLMVFSGQLEESERKNRENFPLMKLIFICLCFRFRFISIMPPFNATINHRGKSSAKEVLF